MTDDVPEQVRQRYATAADAATKGGQTSLELLADGGPGCCSTGSDPVLGADLYALSQSEYLDLLQRAGFEDAEVEFTHEVAPGMHGPIVRTRKAVG